MFSKAWARATSAFAHPADKKAASVTRALSPQLESLRVDFEDLDLDSPSDAFEALRRIVAVSPVIHGEAPEFHRA
ncbi:MAG TPA: hypothetical protein VIC25_05815 [Caulobacteraceae bacterium]|jgi:hypothetical protein